MDILGLIALAKSQNGGSGSGGSDIKIDNTLTKAGYAADAKATGDRIASATIELDTWLTKEGAAAEAKATGNALNQLGNSLGRSISDAATQLGNGIDAVKYAVAEYFDASKTYPSWSFVWRNGVFYYLSAGHEAGVTWENTTGKIEGKNLAGYLTSVMSGMSALNRGISENSSAISELEAEMDASTVTVTGTEPVIAAEPNTCYICGEVSSITITPPSSGICDVTFTSGSTAAVLDVPSTVKFPTWFDATSLETNTIYEINISDERAVVMTWAL